MKRLKGLPKLKLVKPTTIDDFTPNGISARQFLHQIVNAESVDVGTRVVAAKALLDVEDVIAAFLADREGANPDLSGLTDEDLNHMIRISAILKRD